MNDMQRDIEQLGEQLWPDAQILRPRGSAPGSSSGRPARRRGLEVAVTVMVAVVLIAGLAAALVFDRQPATRTAHATPPQATPLAGLATAAQLEAGHWIELPPAPIPTRSGASVVWTGTEMLVWGGATYAGGEKLVADGAAYNPTTGRWRKLPAAPLSARDGQAAVWDGTELLVWGGNDSVSSTDAVDDGAAYNPESNTWRTLPPAPLSARAGAVSVWSGASMIILGGYPAVRSGSFDSLHDGASYDPATNAWTYIASPSLPPGHGIGWDGAVQAGNQLLAWSDWTVISSCGVDCGRSSFGTDIFAFDEATGSWRLMPPAAGAVIGAEQLLWTGTAVIVRGGNWCGVCSEPPRPEVTAEYHPLTNTWTGLDGDPLAWAGDLVSTWTSGALLSCDHATAGGPSTGPLMPGNASAWDARSGWVRLPTAPFGCDGPALWTGTEVLFYYGDPSRSASDVRPGGLALIAGA